MQHISTAIGATDLAKVPTSDKVALLKSAEDGIEVYTEILTGVSGMSQTTLAKLCGVSQSAMSQALSNLISCDCPESLKAWRDKAFTLISCEGFEVEGKGVGNLIIYLDQFCYELIDYYSEYGKTEKIQFAAFRALKLFGKLGIRVWLHSRTGWKPPEVSNPRALPPAIEAVHVSYTAGDVVGANKALKAADLDKLASNSLPDPVREQNLREMLRCESRPYPARSTRVNQSPIVNPRLLNGGK